MNRETINLIENELKSKKIKEYEIYLVEQKIFETEFLKSDIFSEREVNDVEFTIRILTQKKNETGIGIVKGNSLNRIDIKKNIETCIILSKNNSSSKYVFPHSKSIPEIKTADERIIKNPVSIKEDICEEIKAELEQHHEINPTFGRLRVHIQSKCLKNSNDLDLDAIKTFFFIEFALKAQKNGNLSESWETDYIKEKEHLQIKKRVNRWAKIATDTLDAKIPVRNNNATVIFPPHILRNAINPVIGFHILGKSYQEKVSKFIINGKVAIESFNLIDDGLIPGGLMSDPWDGEGNPHQQNLVITNGIFQKRLYDQKYGILENTESTGNGNRLADGSIINSISNLRITPGDISLDEIISNIKEGYYIEKCSWLNPDQYSGSFGTEIRNGYYIKNGKILYPIKGGNLSGNVLEMIKNCKYISKEFEVSANSIFPYITFSNLTVSS
jgi:PmbA protein